MPFAPMGGSVPPSPGVPAPSGSTGVLQGLATQYGIPLGGGSAPTGRDYFPYIYTGRSPLLNSVGYNPIPGLKNMRQDPKRDLLDAQEEFMQSGAKNIRHMALMLAMAGYAGDTVDAEKAVEFAKLAPLNTVYALHLDFLKEAANLYGMGKKITPEQYLRKQLDYRLGDQWNGDLDNLTIEKVEKGELGGKTSQAGTFSQTSKSVDLMSPADAKSLVRGLLQQNLGRDPTQAEYEDFLSAVSAAEHKNPTVSTTTYTTDEQGRQTSASTKTTGGLSSQGVEQLMYEKLKKQPSWAEWQAVGTYAPALFEALGATVGGV